MPKPPGILTTPALRRAAQASAVAGLTAKAHAAEVVLRREAEALLAVVEQRKLGGGAGFYELGRALTELLDRRLYLVLGHSAFVAMVTERKLMSPALAWRLVAIFRSIPKGLARKLGPERAFEWLRVLRLEAGPEAEPAEVRSLAAAKLEVAGRPVAELSVSELVAVRRKMLSRQEAPRKDPGAAGAHGAARALAQHLNHLGAKDARVTARFSGSAWRIRADLSVADARALVG